MLNIKGRKTHSMPKPVRRYDGSAQTIELWLPNQPRQNNRSIHPKFSGSLHCRRNRGRRNSTSSSNRRRLCGAVGTTARGAAHIHIAVDALARLAGPPRVGFPRRCRRCGRCRGRRGRCGCRRGRLSRGLDRLCRGGGGFGDRVGRVGFRRQATVPAGPVSKARAKPAATWARIIDLSFSLVFSMVSANITELINT
jgi:hypothetical protein